MIPPGERAYQRVGVLRGGALESRAHPRVRDKRAKRPHRDCAQPPGGIGEAREEHIEGPGVTERAQRLDGRHARLPIGGAREVGEDGEAPGNLPGAKRADGGEAARSGRIADRRREENPPGLRVRDAPEGLDGAHPHPQILVAEHRQQQRQRGHLPGRAEPLHRLAAHRDVLVGERDPQGSHRLRSADGADRLHGGAPDLAPGVPQAGARRAMSPGPPRRPAMRTAAAAKSSSAAVKCGSSSVSARPGRDWPARPIATMASIPASRTSG